VCTGWQRLCQVLDDKQLPYSFYSNQQCTIYTDCNRIDIVKIKYMFVLLVEISTIYQLDGTYIHTNK